MSSVLVHNIKQPATADKLIIHFQKRKNRGGDVDSIIYPLTAAESDAALVNFEEENSEYPLLLPVSDCLTLVKFLFLPNISFLNWILHIWIKRLVKIYWCKFKKLSFLFKQHTKSLKQFMAKVVNQFLFAVKHLCSELHVWTQIRTYLQILNSLLNWNLPDLATSAVFKI